MKVTRDLPAGVNDEQVEQQLQELRGQFVAAGGDEAAAASSITNRAEGSGYRLAWSDNAPPAEP